MDDLSKDLMKARAATLAQDLTNARSKVLDLQSTGSHGLELVCSKAGVSYVNDSRSTFLDSTLRSLGSIELPIIWVVSKHLILPPDGWFVDLIRNKVRSIVLYGPQAEDALNASRKIINDPYHADELRTSVFLARELALENEVVLFSPGVASKLDSFANYEERGSTYRRAVNDL